MNLPDFDEMLELTELIRDLTLHLGVLDNQIKQEESFLYQRFMTDSSLFYNGKPLSTSAVKSAYEHTGLRGELVVKRNELAQVKADLEKAKLRFDVYKMMIDVYRTEAANKRASAL
jgi:hypothetical protein